MRRRALWRAAWRVYSSDQAFGVAANLAAVLVCVLIVMWLVLAFGPRQSTAAVLAREPYAFCIYLPGQCGPIYGAGVGRTEVGREGIEPSTRGLKVSRTGAKQGCALSFAEIC
jgi:hypothetical protein